MTKRFRMVAGPNGSGKSTLVAREDGMVVHVPTSELPNWFGQGLLKFS